jgi:zinc protease
MIYQGTPYAHPEEGYVQSVASITLDDVRDFYTSHYTADNLVVGVGGGYPAGFAERVRSDFDALPSGAPAAVPAPRPAPLDGVKVLIVEKPTDASAISFGFPFDLVRRNDPGFWSMKLVNAWFGEHRSSFSHLYQVIRERRGMNYGDYSYIEPFPASYTTQERPINASRRSNFFEIWIRPISLTAPDNLHDRTLFATRAAWRELDLLVENGLPVDQIDRTRQYLHNFSVTYGSTVNRRLAFAVDDRFFGFPAPGYLASIRPGLATLDKATVDGAIRRYLQADNMVLVLITADAEGMKQKLLSGQATLIDYNADQPAELLAEDQEIGSFPIPLEEGDITILDISEVFEGG